MICINDTHPDLEEFITHKTDLNKTNGANMSIKMSDAFFDRLKAKQTYDSLSDKEKEKSKWHTGWELKFHRDETGEDIRKVVDPEDIMNLIAKTAWDYGEPGILYWDRVNNYCLLQHDPNFRYEATNPCGELPLPSGGACLLGAMNLSKFFDVDFFKYNTENGQAAIMKEKFAKMVETAVHYLNEVLEEGIDLNPLPEQKVTSRKYMPIGLGIMGLADVFINAGVKYGSKESIAISDKIGYIMAWSAIKASCDIAKEKCHFSVCNHNYIVNSDFFKYNVLENPFYTLDEKDRLIADVKKYGLRNAQLLTIAPTGTTSTILNVSGGIEPMFSTHYTRTTKTIKDHDETYEMYPKVVQEYFKEHPEINNDVNKLPEYFVTARNISPKERIDVQAVWQTHIDNSISGTVNLPESATVEDVKNLYIYAHYKGLKGITVFRENCKRGAILNDKSKKKKNKEDKKEATKDMNVSSNTPKIVNNSGLITREQLGKRLDGATYYVRIGCGHLYITVNKDENGNLVEVFMSSSKSGGCSANAESLGRYASACLRSGMDIETVIDITRGVKCPACTSLKGKGYDIDGLSCGDAMARVLKEEYEHIQSSKTKNQITESVDEIVEKETTEIDVDQDDDWDYKDHTFDENIDYGVCPDCGRELINAEGCVKCYCGFTKC